MPWSDRQQAMLAEMGLKVWAPAAPSPEAAAALPPVVPVASAPAFAPAPAVTVPAAPGLGAGLPSPQQAASPQPAQAPQAQAHPAGPAAAPPQDGPHAARAARIATLSWEALQVEVATCRACALCEKRQQTVFGVGHPQAEWMVVGEAPGEQEDRRGEPFVGPAGQLLDNMLAALGLSRHAEAPAALASQPAVSVGKPGNASPAVARPVFIANTLKCRPPHNRNPSAEELALCAPLLHRQIALVQPRILLASGKFAIEQLTGSHDPVGRLRGRVHHFQGIPVVVTYHPAYLLRQLPDKAKAWDDLCLAMATYEALPPR